MGIDSFFDDVVDSSLYDSCMILTKLSLISLERSGVVYLQYVFNYFIKYFSFFILVPNCLKSS